MSGCSMCVDGLFSTLGCQGAPAYGSGPHFLSGAEYLSKDVDGLHPDVEKHTTFLNIEPMTGITFQAHKRIQINFHMSQVEKISALSQVRNVFFPLLWSDEGADITEEWKSKYTKMVKTPFLLVDIFTYLGISVGSLFILLSLANVVLKLRSQ